MKKVPYGKVITVGTIREYFAELSGADFTEPITAGIFVSIVAWASYQRSEDETPWIDSFQVLQIGHRPAPSNLNPYEY